MALYRTLFRRKGCIFTILLASTFWIAYLIISSPAARDQKFPSVDAIYDSGFKRPEGKSVTRKYATVAHILQKPPKLEPKDIVLQAPQVFKEPNNQENPDQNVQESNGSQKDEKKEEFEIVNEDKAAKEQVADVKKEDTDVKINNLEEKKSTENKSKEQIDLGNNKLMTNISLINETKSDNLTKGPVVKDVGQQVIELGQKFKNKTIEVGANIKNKTIEKLADLGVIQKKNFIKLIFRKVRWNLNVSLADIGFIMKDTEFLKKKQNLTDMEYQPLSPINSTGIVDFNLTKSKYGLGYCDCKDLLCLCCVRIQNKWLKVNNSACSQLNFVSKSQELQFEFRMDDKPIYKDTIAAEFPPKICLESDSAAAGACVLFSNVTSHVNIASENHKIHLSGCMEIALTLFNKTLSDFPVGCFKIPGPGTEKEHEHNANFGNFVP